MSSTPGFLPHFMDSLGYQFNNSALLTQALTHCSASAINNERLEFLGDSLLNFIIAEELFYAFSNQTEGELSRLRSFLVKGDTLADIATDIHLGEHLLLGQGELKTGGNGRQSILADAVEAIIAAVFLDGGIEPCKAVILKLYRKKLASLTQQSKVDGLLKDPKTRLQEYLQASKHALPTYTLLKTEGKAHEQIFYVKCSVQDIEQPVIGSGPNRRKAEQEAAMLMLERLNI